MIVQMNTSAMSVRMPSGRKRTRLECFVEALRNNFPKEEMTKKEFFKVLTLDIDFNVTGCIHAGTGGKDSCPVSFREVARGIAELDARFIVLGHNHPSGKLFPSYLDVQLTEDISKLARMLNVVIVDHIILTSTGYYSFVADNKLKI